MNLAYKKILGKFTKVLGFGKTPPPCWEKFPNDIVFFFESVPMAEMMMGKFLRGAVNFKLGPNLLSLNFEPFPWTTDLVFTRKV